jgi:hypothetical protein
MLPPPFILLLHLVSSILPVLFLQQRTCAAFLQVPTTDVPVHTVPEVLQVYNKAMRTKIALLLGEQ